MNKNSSSNTTVKEQLRILKRTCTEHNIPSAEAEQILCSILQKEKTWLITNGDELISSDDLKQIEHIVQERIQGKPLAYLIGQKEFFERIFQISPQVLIPRQETEELIELVFEELSKYPETTTVLDVGTGSGCIGITLALEKPSLQVFASDLSMEALKVAFSNTTSLQVENIELIHTDLLQNMDQVITKNHQPLIIVANLPYIPENSPDVQASVHHYEPHSALYSGPDGLNHYRALFGQLSKTDWKVNSILLEIDHSQRESLTTLIQKDFPQWKLDIKKDIAGHDRFAILTPLSETSAAE